MLLLGLGLGDKCYRQGCWENREPIINEWQISSSAEEDLSRQAASQWPPPYWDRPSFKLHTRWTTNGRRHCLLTWRLADIKSKTRWIVREGILIVSEELWLRKRTTTSLSLHDTTHWVACCTLWELLRLIGGAAPQWWYEPLFSMVSALLSIHFVTMRNGSFIWILVEDYFILSSMSRAVPQRWLRQYRARDGGGQRGNTCHCRRDMSTSSVLLPAKARRRWASIVLQVLANISRTEVERGKGWRSRSLVGGVSDCAWGVSNTSRKARKRLLGGPVRNIDDKTKTSDITAADTFSDIRTMVLSLILPEDCLEIIEERVERFENYRLYQITSNYMSIDILSSEWLNKSFRKWGGYQASR